MHEFQLFINNDDFERMNKFKLVEDPTIISFLFKPVLLAR